MSLKLELKDPLRTGYLIPIWIEHRIIDMTRLLIRIGNLTKKFNNYDEMEKWKKKANKLSRGWRDKK